MLAYIGCRTTKERNARGKGISVYRAEDKDWTHLQILEGEVNPSYLCLNKKEDRLYAIHGDYSEVSSYQIAPDGSLTKMNTVSTYGTNPVHLLLSPSEKWLYVANLQTGSVAVIPVLKNGELGNIRSMQFVSGNGGPGYISHPHQICLDKTGQWMLVPAQGRLQGIGKVTVYQTDEEEGTLKEVSHVKARTGGEPRSCVFHPNNRRMYFLNEKDSTIWYNLFDPDTGLITPQQILSVLPEDYSGDGWASGLLISEDGSMLYASNRKHDSITVLRTDKETGKMTYVQNIKTGGGQPRFIALTPDGTQLIAANETTDTLTIFEIDPEDGTLVPSGQIPTESPVCAVFKTK